MNLTSHFTLEELVASQAAIRLDLANTPNPPARANLQRLAEKLEEVRKVLGHPVIVQSAYRSPAVNTAIGGHPESQHKQGLAADIIAPHAGTPRQVAAAILAAGIEFDQLILEGDAWVHISIAEPGHGLRGDVLTANFIGGRGALYHRGIT